MAHVACFTAPLYVCAPLRPPHLLSFSSRLSLEIIAPKGGYIPTLPRTLFSIEIHIYIYMCVYIESRIYIYVWTISPVRTLFASCLRHFSRRLSCTKCNTFDCTHVQVLWPKWLPELESWSLKGGGEEKKVQGSMAMCSTFQPFPRHDSFHQVAGFTVSTTSIPIAALVSEYGCRSWVWEPENATN